MLRKQVNGAAAQPRIGGPISYIKPNGRQLQATAKEGSTKKAAKSAAAAQPELQGSWWVPDSADQKPAAVEDSAVQQKGAETGGKKVGKVCR